jgi:putative ABC transport system permease protein
MIRPFFITFRLAIYSLLLHKLRTGLAVIGILIGITAVIWLVAMGQGVSYQAQKQIEDLGARNIIVRSVKPADQGSTSTTRSFFLEYGLLRDDYRRIVSNIPAAVLEQVVPLREMRKEIRRDEYVVQGRVVGCTPAYFDLNNLRMERGRFLQDRDGDPPENVAVIGAMTAQQLFPLEDPIGKSIQIDRDFYVVVGQTAERDPTAAIGGSLDSQDYNLDVYVPLETLRWRVGDMVFTSRSGSREGEIIQLSQITLTVSDKDRVFETADIVRSLLEKYHPKQDFGVVVPQELLRQAKLIEMMFNLLLVIIAGISLIVGGIGIMNIMLATVTERTREIGIRRALGAKRRDIIRQFLAESVVLTGVGGVLGVGCGFLVSPVVHGVRTFALDVFPDMMAALPPVIMELEPRIASWSIMVSLMISIGVGVVFGLYPALRAAYMDPIEALRHE